MVTIIMLYGKNLKVNTKTMLVCLDSYTGM